MLTPDATLSAVLLDLLHERPKKKIENREQVLRSNYTPRKHNLGGGGGI